MLSSGEKLDLFPNFAFSTITAANTGQILALDDLLPEYGKDILSVVPDTDWNCVSIGGQIYGVPNNKDKAEGFGLAMRTDMLEASGYDISSIKTEKDLEGLFAAVKEKYPDSYPWFPITEVWVITILPGMTWAVISAGWRTVWMIRK